MAIEIERKFLVKGEFRHHSVDRIMIIQKYLVIDSDKTVRIRIANGKAFITIKGRPEGNSIMRNEWEIPLPLKEAEEIMKLCLPGIIEKTRYLVPLGKNIWEVDVFHGGNEGLIIAELELSSETEEFERPVWLGEEVTGRPEYYNANLLK